MTWAKLDDQIHRNRKILAVSPAARWLFISSISYSRDNDLGGHLTPAEVSSLIGSQGVPKRCADELRPELWEPDEDGGIQIHDYDQYNPPTGKERQRRYRERHRDDQSDVTSDVTPPVTSDVTPRARAGYPDSRPPIPVNPVVPSGRNGATAPRSRSEGTNPRAQETNPRAVGTNPRRVLAPQVQEVFDAWLSTLAPGTQRDLTPARAKVIRARLADSPLDELLDAVRGWTNDPWPERATQNDLTILLRNRQQVEKFRDLHRGLSLSQQPNVVDLPPQFVANANIDRYREFLRRQNQ